MEVAPAALLGSPMDGEAEGQVTAWTGGTSPWRETRTKALADLQTLERRREAVSAGSGVGKSLVLTQGGDK
jgi:hypothetical protein